VRAHMLISVAALEAYQAGRASRVPER